MSLSLDALDTIHTVVVHKQNDLTPCQDGRASAMLFRLAYPDVRVVEMAYSSSAHRSLEPQSGVAFADFSPWVPAFPEDREPTLEDYARRREALLPWVEARAVVLDHHSPDLVGPFAAAGLGVWGDNARAESGAVLVYRHVVQPVWGTQAMEHARELAELIAVRDTWRRDDPRFEEASVVSNAMNFPPLDALLNMSVRAFRTFADHLGPMLRAKKMEAVAAAASTAVRLVTDTGLRVALIPSPGLTSDVADVLTQEDTDIVAGFEHVQEAGAAPVIQWSLRSRGDVDVRAIARRHGGGGHVPAAGFRVLDDGRSPYVRARELLSVKV